MTKAEMTELLKSELVLAASTAQRILGVCPPSLYIIELHGAGSAGRRMTLNEAIEHLYINENRYWKIIDVVLKAIGAEESIFFVRASEHKPCLWEDTFDPARSGPFKQLEPLKIARE